MATKTAFKGFKQINGLASGFTESSLEQGYVYFVRTSTDKTEGYIYFNGKKYGNIDTAGISDSKMSDTSTNPVQNKVVKAYVDEGDMYPIVYKTTDGTGTIYAYKDASYRSKVYIKGSSTGGVLWIDRNYDRIEFDPEFKSLNLLQADTRNITNMRQMFYFCYKLTSLDLSFFDTSKVTNMNSMFNGCSGLTSLDLSSFDTSKVTDMTAMFSGCTLLTNLDLSSFDTSQVTNMNSIFETCSTLTSLDLRNFNTENVTDMTAMFCNCPKLTSLDLSSFDTSQVTDMSNMFWACISLSKLTLSSSFFNSTSLTTYDFSELTGWTDTDSLANLVSVLPTITTTKTLKLSSNTKSALTADQTSTITTKGWAIS